MLNLKRDFAAEMEVQALPVESLSLCLDPETVQHSLDTLRELQEYRAKLYQRMERWGAPEPRNCTETEKQP